MDSAAEPTEVPLEQPSADSDPGGFAHVPQLDGIRGVAVAMTVLNHLLLTNEHPGSRVVTFLTSIRISLWLGVDVFLALSGFLITGILFDTLRSPRHLRSFYGRRVLRIFPLYYLALAVLGLLTVPAHIEWHGYEWLLVTFLQNTPLWFLHPPDVLQTLSGHLWSIAVEEQFYLFWPLLILLVRDRRRLMTTALVLSAASLALRVSIVAHGGSSEYTYKMLPCRLDGLLLGGWLALAFRGPMRQALIKWGGAVFCVFAAVLLVECVRESGLDWRTSHFVNSVGYSLAAITSTALIAAVFRARGLLAQAFHVRFLRWLGRYSYGIYVWHLILAGFVIAPTRVFVARLHLGKGPQMIAGAIVGTAFSVLAGVVSYHGFEVFFLRLKKFFPYRIS